MVELGGPLSAELDYLPGKVQVGELFFEELLVLVENHLLSIYIHKLIDMECQGNTSVIRPVRPPGNMYIIPSSLTLFFLLCSQSSLYLIKPTLIVCFP